MAPGSFSDSAFSTTTRERCVGGAMSPPAQPSKETSGTLRSFQRTTPRCQGGAPVISCGAW